MKAAVLETFGPADNLELKDVDKPKAGPREALVRVRASSVNLADTGVRSGMFGEMMTPPLILGFDAAGVIEDVGAGVEGFSAGDEVYYAIDLMDRKGGANAQYHVTDAAKLVRKPANISFEEAAAAPVAGGTAYAALFSSADLRLGQSVLIHGAAGGVGSYAVQLAKAAGAFVFASCGAYDAEVVKGLGADVVIDYQDEDVSEVVKGHTNGSGVDVVLDAAGGQLVRSIKAVKMNGQLVTITGAGGDLSAATRKNLRVHFVHLENAVEKLGRLSTLFERGQIRSVISKTFGLEQLSEAHKLLEKGGEAVHGKIVIEIP